MKAVFYRYNETLAARVKAAAVEFAHEFPAEATVQEIRAAMPAILKTVPRDADIYVDATVLGADVVDRPHLIRQDGVSAYDWYAERVAEAVKGLNHWKGPRVTIVRDCIADHNSEAVGDWNRYGGEDSDGLYRMEAESAAVQKWVQRLRGRGVDIKVVEAKKFESTLTHEERFGGGEVRDRVVISDHHNGEDLRRLIEARKGMWFNAFPPCREGDL